MFGRNSTCTVPALQGGWRQFKIPHAPGRCLACDFEQFGFLLNTRRLLCGHRIQVSFEGFSLITQIYRRLLGLFLHLLFENPTVKDCA